jgi:3-oxoacyl-[acyl-carrier-protein] synthase II
MLSPLGCGTEITWSRLLAGQNAAARISGFEVDDIAAQIACQIPTDTSQEGHYNADDWMEPKEQRKVDPFITYAVAAAKMALDDADWHPESDDDQFATGVLIGSGIGGLQGIVDAGYTLKDRGPRRISPFFIPGRLIALGDADVMVAGGAESPVCRISIAGFAACKALSTQYNDDPQRASRPYDIDRDGFVMGEGAGIMVLEELEHAKARGANIIAEVVGYGLSGDAYHITAPSEDGDGAYRCMKMALKRAGLDAGDVDYINAHGTSTMADTIELGAVERLVGENASKISMSSTKSAIGHLLGAAGSVEAIFSALAIRDNIVPPTLNLDNPAIETKIDLVPKVARKRNVDVALSNSFGFGGTNASLVLRRYA